MIVNCQRLVSSWFRQRLASHHVDLNKTSISIALFVRCCSICPNLCWRHAQHFQWKRNKMQHFRAYIWPNCHRFFFCFFFWYNKLKSLAIFKPKTNRLMENDFDNLLQIPSFSYCSNLNEQTLQPFRFVFRLSLIFHSYLLRHEWKKKWNFTLYGNEPVQLNVFFVIVACCYNLISVVPFCLFVCVYVLECCRFNKLTFSMVNMSQTHKLL